ncbi:MAG: hypothetical protein ACJ762_09315 [Solirubrobacteraceae bacterium]
MGRLRWRMAGAWQWPLFALLTVVDAVLLRVLPISGTGTPLVSGLLLAMFFNLVAVAGLGRLVAWAMQRRDPGAPRLVAEDRAGVILVTLVTLAIVVGGILHAPGADDAIASLEAQEKAARAFVLAHGDEVHRRNLSAIDTEQHAEDFFRTCVPGAGDVPALCLLIDTSVDPPKVVVDTDRSPNRHL